MRLRTALIAVCLLMAATPVFGASQRDHDDCNADDADRNITGCTRVINDRTESRKVRGIALVGRALAWKRKGDRDRAIADLTDAIRVNPNDALAYNNRANTWREMGEVDRAIADLTEAIRIDPKPRSDLAGPGHVTSTPIAASPSTRRAIMCARWQIMIRRSSWIRTTPRPCFIAARSIE